MGQRVQSPSSGRRRPQFSFQEPGNQPRVGYGYRRLDEMLPPMLLIGIQVIGSAALAAVGVAMTLHGGNIGFMVVWFAVLVVITVLNIRKQLRRRRMPRIPPQDAR